MTRTKKLLTIISLVIAAYALPSRGDCRGDSKAVKVSGGEDHTLLVTADKGAWSCGPNGGIHVGVGDYWGVLGTGSTQRDFYQASLVRVYDGAMATDSNCLENITDIDAGWKHSLALDLNGFAWSWGWNSQGQLGIDNVLTRTTPVQVFRGDQADDPCEPSAYLKHIIAISAGRSGEHSLGADANGYVYAWGRNEEGQCGNGVSGTGYRELVPVHVWSGEQEPEDPCNPDPNLTRIVAVSAGEWHSMALEAYDPYDPNLDGRVYTWGDNDFVLNNGSGVLGVGAADDSNTPVCVRRGQQDYNDPNQIYLKHIVAISAGWDHSMALEEDDPWDPNLNGRVYTWGNNGQGWGSGGGRLGNGSAMDGNSTPVLVLRAGQT